MDLFFQILFHQQHGRAEQNKCHVQEKSDSISAFVLSNNNHKLLVKSEVQRS